MHKNNCFSVYFSRAVIGGHFDTKIIVIDQADQKLWAVIGAPPPRGKFSNKGYFNFKLNIPKILQKLLKKNNETTFNAISCDGDTSTNDMVSIFSTCKANNSLIKNINEKKINEFDNSLHAVMLNLAKRVASDGEGASKFITIDVKNCKTQEDAKKIAFSIANSPLVKTAISGEDPNWGRIIMAIGKANTYINLNNYIQELLA